MRTETIKIVYDMFESDIRVYEKTIGFANLNKKCDEITKRYLEILDAFDDFKNHKWD